IDAVRAGARRLAQLAAARLAPIATRIGAQVARSAASALEGLSVDGALQLTEIAAVVAPGAAFMGVLFLPTNKNLREDVAGPNGMHVVWSPDETKVRILWKAPDGTPR